MSENVNIAFLASLRERRARIDALIDSVEAYLRAEGVDVAALQQPVAAPAAEPTPVPVSAQATKKGVFEGMPLTEAVKKHLEKLGQPQTVAEITAALQKAGRTDAKRTGVYNALWRRRDRVGDVESLPDNRWRVVAGATPKPPADRKLGSRNGLTMYSGAEQILREAGKPLHADVIVERLAEMGKPTNTRSLSGTLPQDVQKRFENLGRNMWALAEWPPAQKELPGLEP